MAVRSPLNAFCVDLEEWFHHPGVQTLYSDPQTWNDAQSCVEQDTEVLMRLLDEAGVSGTFLTVGWIAERYPALIERLVEAGHEIGCHTYYHQLLRDFSPEEFREDTARCLDLLRTISGQPVTTFRAPGFSMTRECFWAFPILRQLGIEIDVSVVPAARDYGGVRNFPRNPFVLNTEAGELKIFPVSVMDLMGRRIQFSGGGYLRLFPTRLIKQGFRRNHAEGRPGMSYIHPREINPDQPRLKLPPMKSFKYYFGLRSTENKLRELLRTFEFTTVSEVFARVQEVPRYRLANGDVVPV